MVLESPEPGFERFGGNGEPMTDDMMGSDGSSEDAIRRTLRPGSIYFKSTVESFTLGYMFQNRPVIRTIPWRNCTPDPSITKKWFTRRNGGLAVKDLYNSVSTFEEGTQRPLNDEEMSAFAYYSGKKLQTVSYYWKGAAIVGTLLWWRQRATFKVPFLRVPKDPSRFDVFPHRAMPLLRGPLARATWMSQRLGIYLFLAVPCGFLFGLSSGTAAQVIGIKNDPRTQGLVKQAADRMRERIAAGQPVAGQIGRRGPPRRGQALPPPPTPQNAQNGSNENPDYYSPTPGASPSTDTGVLNDAQMRTRDRKQQPPSRSSDATTQSSYDSNKTQPEHFPSDNSSDRYASSFSRDFSGSNDRDRYSSYSDSAPSQSSSFDWTEDSASPASGNERDPYLSSPSSSTSPGGSSWDRLRQDSMSSPKGRSPPTSQQQQQQQQSPSSPPPQYSPPSSSTAPPQGASAWQRIRTGRPPPQPSSPPRDQSEQRGESYSFSSEDEDRNSAKIQAQKEFDEMLERERRGEGEDNGSGGGGGGWRR